MNKSKVLLIVGVILLAIGFLKPDLAQIVPNRVPATIDNMELSEPNDEALKKEANDIVTLLKSSNGSKKDFKALRDLALDLAQLISLDGDDLVIKNTDDIRQANSISGAMLRLDIKGKYANLAKEAKEVIIAGIGDDNVTLNSNLRKKGVESFHALAWAYNEASK